jgi:hypothetical protein
MSRTQLVAILSAVALLLLVLEMVRRRRLREEYSWIWLLTAMGYLLVAVWPNLGVWVAGAIGSDNPQSTFTFIGLLFLFLISIQFSVQISSLTEQNKDLAQQIAILDSEIRKLAKSEADEVRGDQSGGNQADAERADD